MSSRLLLAIALASSLLALPRPVHAGRIPCSDVIAEVDRSSSEDGVYKGADPVQVARRLKVPPLWVERCAETYGRRLKRSAPLGVSPEILTERWESDEPEEVGKEELEAKGDVFQQPLEDVDKRPENIPDSTHVWSPDVGNTWSPTMPPLWGPAIHDNDLGVTP
jgi:hypothetical protein